MIAFVYRDQLHAGAKAEIYLAETLNSAKSLEHLPRMKWHGLDVAMKPTDHRCWIEEEPNGTVECVVTRVVNLIKGVFPGATAKWDADFNRRVWKVYVVIPA